MIEPCSVSEAEADESELNGETAVRYGKTDDQLFVLRCLINYSDAAGHLPLAAAAARRSSMTCTARERTRPVSHE